jgi:hypothetical protein
VTGRERQTLRHLIDGAVRSRVSWDDIEPRARRADMEIAAACGICGACSSAIPEERRQGRSASLVLYCSDLCRKRSHYHRDVARARERKLRLVS